MSHEDLSTLLHQLELTHQENRIIAHYLHQLVCKLDHFNTTLDQLLLLCRPGRLTVRRLSKVKGVKKIIIKQLNVHRLDQLVFNLDSIDIDELSGAMNIGISEEFSVKHFNHKEPSST